ncbi:MAG: hypothetical protein A2X47_07625 [Lentisphaerae bacterium GWF2_38_69]|nr:MAG: hypothetical protein A2X47_07625 [Lentisphaerae bacterium GWF2_38_69]
MFSYCCLECSIFPEIIAVISVLIALAYLINTLADYLFKCMQSNIIVRSFSDNIFMPLDCETFLMLQVRFCFYSLFSMEFEYIVMNGILEIFEFCV